MAFRFSQHIFHSDKFWYAKHARAFRTQIDLNKKNNADQFGYGKHALSKVVRTKQIDWPIWVRKERVVLHDPNPMT
jgi:hypothetical protein